MRSEYILIMCELSIIWQTISHVAVERQSSKNGQLHQAKLNNDSASPDVTLFEIQFKHIFYGLN